MRPIKPPMNNISWVKGHPYSNKYDDIYYQDDVINETNHVFLSSNNLKEKWGYLENQEFNIGELGFGLGLNFFITLQNWVEANKSCSHLNFISFDKYAPKEEDIKKIQSYYPELRSVIEIYLKNTPAIFGGINKIKLKELNATLLLVIDDVQEGLESVAHNRHMIDAWFFDGFDPRKNNEMWTANVFMQVGLLSHKETSFGTYTASGVVKRSLLDSGFHVKKVKGFNKKRHMLIGTYTSGSRPHSSPCNVAVIGSGLAASILSKNLADGGCSVHVYEKNSDIASETSSNPWAAMYPKLALGDDPRSFFLIQSYFFALNFYINNFKSFINSGILFLSNSEHRRDWLNRLMKVNRTDVFEQVDKNEIDSKHGICQPYDGVLCKFGGAISPKKVSTECLNHKNITIFTNSKFESYSIDNDKVHLNINNSEINETYNYLVICSGVGIQSQVDKVKTMKGAIIGISSPQLRGIQQPLNHSGYILPPKDEINWMGSSYEKGSEKLSDDFLKDEILQKSKKAIPFKETNVKKFWSGTRITSPDRLPVAGKLNDENVYCIGALASRGLSFAPLLGDYVACKILGLFNPLSKNLQEALDPLRFKN